MKWLLAAILAITSVLALNGLTEMNVVVIPDIASQTFQYNFVFSDSSSCGVLLNSSVNITTNPAGRGNATLDLTSLVTTPSYLCTYRNGTLVNKQSLNRNAFEQGNITSTTAAIGYVPIFNNANNLVSWILSGQLLNASGFNASNLTSGTIPDARISSTFNNQTYACSFYLTGNTYTLSCSGNDAGNYSTTFSPGNITGSGINGTLGHHVFQTNTTNLWSSNLSENQFALFYPNSILIGLPFGTALLVNGTSNRTGINNTNPTSTLDVIGNVSISSNLHNFAGIFVNGSQVGNVSGGGNTGNLTFWINNYTIGSVAVGPYHLNNTSTAAAGMVPTYYNSSMFAWVNKTNITIITATGATNWNKPPGIGYVSVFICGGGGGGAGGDAAAQGAIRSGGGGGGGAMCVTKTFNAADLTDPVSVTIGGGGAAVAAASDGSVGTSSTFGGYITAYGGGGGGFAAGAGGGGGGGGGCAALGTSSTTGTGATGGACMIAAVAANTASVHGGGAGGGTAGAGIVNGPMAWLAGAGGGTATTAGGNVGGGGGSSQYSAAGGGGGGGVNAAVPGVARDGGAGGNTGANVIVAGGGGTAGTAAGACGGVGDGQVGTSGYFGVGGKGGGGGGAKSAVGTAGCTGGVGGAFGGGGGGGGGGTTGGAGGGGGKGGDGGAIIIAW